MARVVYSSNALAHFERVLDSFTDSPASALRAVTAIHSAVAMLEHHPLIGRIVSDEVRELVVSFGRSGYLVLYEHISALDQVWTYAVRHQRELDYP